MHLLPTTMVGSYPRPAWFTHQLAGRDVLEAFKVASHAEAFHDATRVVIKDQEDAGLDILSDGQMWFDDYHMGIGSFLWYRLERTRGFSAEKLPHPARATPPTHHSIRGNHHGDRSLSARIVDRHGRDRRRQGQCAVAGDPGAAPRRARSRARRSRDRRVHRAPGRMDGGVRSQGAAR